LPAASSVWRGRIVALGAIAAGLLLAGYLFMGFRRTMLAGIEEIQSGLGRMGNGVLNVPLAVTSRDAFGEVALALNEMQTSLRTRMDQERSCRHNLRIRNALDKASTNIMLADVDGRIVYCNEPFLNAAEAERHSQRSPGFAVHGLVGANFDTFHKNPAHQRNLLGALRGEHRATVRIGGRTFSWWPIPSSTRRGASRVRRGVAGQDKRGAP
jgi:methyl-accepting chemotaxis protein